jgi:hypothetical protein
MRNRGFVRVLLLAMFLVWFGSTRDVLAAPDPVAYIEHVYPNTLKVRDVVRIKRGGQWMTITDESVALYPDDQIYVSDANAVVTVRYLADNSVEPVRDRASGVPPYYTVRRPSLPGLTSAVSAWFEAQLRGADQSGSGLTLASSRAVTKTCFNATGKTDEPVQFNVPVFSADQSQIVSGDRALFVSWRGGATPFVVRLSSADNGIPLAEMSNIRDRCWVTLPRVDLKPGRYRVAVIDAKGTTEEEAMLIAVSHMPDMPATLRDASLPDNERSLYYQTWLSATDGGRWAFEAMQHVATMDCKWAPVREWLERWGGVPDCGP